MRTIKMKSILTYLVMGGALLLSASSTEAFVFQDRVATSKSLSHYAMGQIYDLLGLINRAVLEYEKAAQFDNSSYLIYLRLGADYARLNMLNEAQEALELVEIYNPDDLQSHYLLALIHSTEKEYEKAAEEYEYILTSFAEADPENIEVYQYLGQLYYSQRKYDQAIAQFEKIISLEPRNADVMYLLGSLYLEVDQIEEAISILKKSIEIDPEHDGSLNTLGYLYAENNQNLEEAMELVNKALELRPDNGAYFDSLGWIYFKQGKYQKSLEHLKKADAVLRDPVIYDHLGDVYYELNEMENALKYWELSLKLMPQQKEVERKLSEVKNIQASR